MPAPAYAFQSKRQKATSAANRSNPKAICISPALIRSAGRNSGQSSFISWTAATSALFKSYGIGKSFSCGDALATKGSVFTAGGHCGAVEKSQMENFSFLVIEFVIAGMWSSARYESFRG
jgi:hypothetical protein